MANRNQLSRRLDAVHDGPGGQVMIGGEGDPQVLARLARGSLRRKHGQLAEAVPGLTRDHHRFLPRDRLDNTDHLSRWIGILDARIEEATSRSRGPRPLESVPGVARRSAEATMAEIGDDIRARRCPATTRAPKSGGRSRRAGATRG